MNLCLGRNNFEELAHPHQVWDAAYTVGNISHLEMMQMCDLSLGTHVYQIDLCGRRNRNSHLRWVNSFQPMYSVLCIPTYLDIHADTDHMVDDMSQCYFDVELWPLWPGVE